MTETHTALETGLSSHAGAAFFCQQLDERGFQASHHEPRILVAGCGAGHEAAAIQQHFDATVDAIDIELQVDPRCQLIPKLLIREASVCDLPFSDETYDAIFYHHVIEHVDDPVRSLVEITRVLRPGGWLFIGTPNRHRLVSSVGAHKQTQWDATLANKLGDNWHDWKARLTGKFRNEFGAHAGFSQSELDKLLAVHFQQRIWLTREYLHMKYAEHRLLGLLKVATLPALCWFAAPSIYVLCRQGTAA
ncbi:MAG TPA: class I SAM-dependent methyltransferase [Pirellulaceae bacterium]|nr:class I SAM-dependent methyltransferase [Pirellulaceae bacterium]